MEQRIEYKGMTSKPSDYQSEDGEMKLAVNAEYRDGGYHAVRIPKDVFLQYNGFEPMFVHIPSNSTYSIYIGSKKDDKTRKYKLSAIIKDNDSINKNEYKEITFSDAIEYNDKSIIGNFCAIGNILVFTFNSKLYYAFYKDGSYKLSKRLPPTLNIDFNILRRYEPNVGINSSDFQMPNSDEYTNYNMANVDDSYHSLWVKIDDAKIVNSTEMTMCKLLNSSENVINFKNAVFAAYNSANAYLQKKGYLLNPVLLRYAYRLYDGTTIMPSAPILMFPPIKPILFYKEWYKHNRLTERADEPLSVYFEAYRIFASSTDNSVMEELSNKWGDIIKSVDFFISPQIYTIESDELDFYMLDGSQQIEGVDYAPQQAIMSFKDRNFKDSIMSTNSFHLICSIDVKDLSNNIGKSNNVMFPFTDKNKITPDDLTSYTEKERLEESIYDNSEMEVGSILSFNNRICASVTRRLLNMDWGISHVEIYNETKRPQKNYYTGFNHKTTYSSKKVEIDSIKELVSKQKTDELNMYVKDCFGILAYRIKNEIDGDYWSTNLMLTESFPKYFFSIDSRIESIGLISNNEDGSKAIIKEFKLKTSDYLNMSYNLNGSYEQIEITESDFQNFQNKPISIYTRGIVKLSEVNNPIVFKDGNSTRCGSGNVLSIVTNTHAVSQGQFGQYPIFAFCSDGVYAISIGTDGTLQNCSPYSYDIITNSKSVANIERDVYFTTEQGVVRISNEGRQLLLHADNTIKYTYDNCINDHQERFMNNAFNGILQIGNPPQMVDLKKYLTTGSRIAYDYPHGRLIVYNPLHNYSYVMETESGMWSVMAQGFHSNLNVYEECLMVKEENTTDGDTQYKVYNYSSDEVEENQKSYLISRPIKLGYPNVHKTINSIIQRGVFCSKDDVKQCLYGSNDLYNWVPVWSSNNIYLSGFRGTGYKYYRQILFLPRFKQEETLQGSTITYEPRMTDKQR